MLTLPRTGAPLRVMTLQQIEAERALYAQTAYNLSHRARLLGIKRSTLEYHLRPIMGLKLRVGSRVQRLIDAGQALMDAMPATTETIAARREWVAAREVITRRKWRGANS